MNWFALAAFAAAFWITLRVMAAVPATEAAFTEPPPADDAATVDGIRDPALERLIARMVPPPVAAARR